SPSPTLFPYTTLFRSLELVVGARLELLHGGQAAALLHPDLTLLGGHAWKGSLRRRSICSPAMGLAEQMERTNRGMIAFDLVLGRSEEHTSELQSLAYL